MRVFVIIFCFAFANTEKLGYTNYGSSGSHHGFGNRFKHRGTPATPAPPPANGIASGVNGGLSGFDADTIPTEEYQPVESQPEFNKEFFTYSAPEEDFNDIDAAQRLAASMRNNLRVLFIRAPENNGIANAALQLAKQTAESKTAIYVLSKQTDYTDLANKLNNVQQGQSERPEVHFIKYRTPEDAVRAQQIIQNEYDALGGPSRISNEGVAPVLNFASPNELVTQKNYGSSSTGISSVSGIGSPSNGYIPSKLRS